MKLFINFSIAVYIMVGVLLLVSPNNILPSFYKPTLMASLAFVSAFIIILPRIVFRDRSNEKKTHKLLRFQAFIALVLLLNGLGGLGLYKLYAIGFEYDKLMHFIGPMLLTILGFEFVSAWFNKSPKASATIAGVLVILGGLLWEILEATSDFYLGTTLLGGGESLAARDTLFDLAMNLMGIFVALGIIKFRFGRETIV